MARTIAKDHDQKRAQILSSAAKVFATEGYDRASMAQLARECGISKANIYHYYDSKDALLFDILKSYLEELRDRICEIEFDDPAPQARLRRAVAEILLAYEGADNEHRVQINGLSFLPAAEQAELRLYQRDLVKFMAAILQDCAPEVFADAPDKLRTTTMSVYGMLNWYFMWNAGADAEAREDYARLVTDLTLGGLRGL